MSRPFQKWLPDVKLSAICSYFRSKAGRDGASSDVVLVQCVEDAYYFGLFGQIASSLREKQVCRVEQYVLRSLNVGEGTSLATFLKSRLAVNQLLRHKWESTYASFCDGVAYRSTSLRPLADLIDLYRAWKCWRTLADRDALVKLEIEGLVVGDLINDSYLRFKPAPTVELHDSYLLILIWQACRDIRRARQYFARTRPKLYLTSYSTYIQHGIPVRVALQHGVRVFSFGNYQEFAKELTLQDWMHTRNPDSYAENFSRLDRQEERLAAADAALTVRLSGGVDSATAYMKKSAYASSGVETPDMRGAAVVFLHDFYDSPHVYRQMVFPDFWEWACYTIDTLRNAGIPFYVKAHPNQIDLSDRVMSSLKQKYLGLRVLPAGLTNRQLVEAGMSCAITVYGTVAHEMAYLGVPVVACAHHPHVSFGFCRTARSRKEYADYLRDCPRSVLDRQAMRRQSLMFYYMHNLDLTDERRALLNLAAAYRFACEISDDQDELLAKLQAMSVHAGYRAELMQLQG